LHPWRRQCNMISARFHNLASLRTMSAEPANDDRVTASLKSE
jgi:hypothetical protein